MNDLLIGLVGAVLATNQPLAVSNLIQQHAGVSIVVTNPNDPEERALDKVMAEDDAAEAEVDKWIRDNNDFYKEGAGEPKDELNQRIMDRFASVRKAYEVFLKQYPNSARGYLAYGSFLNDIGQEDEAVVYYEKSRKLDPKNPAVWNNLANYYGEFSPVTNAFAYYTKAIELNPAEPVYYQNFATTVYLFRKDAREYYHITESQVFDKALDLYRQAMKLDPQNFPLATDYAQSYYGIRPLRTNDALVAWTNALHIARDELEREGVYIHLARVKISIGRFAEAQAHLDAVTNAALADMRNRLQRNLTQREHPGTNSVDEETTSSAITNPPVAATHQIALRTNAVPALRNPPASTPDTASTMANVPPDPPAATKPPAAPIVSPEQKP